MSAPGRHLTAVSPIERLPHTRTDPGGLPVWDVAGLTLSIGTAARGRIGVAVRVTRGEDLDPTEIDDVVGALAAAGDAARAEQAIEDRLDAAPGPGGAA